MIDRVVSEMLIMPLYYCSYFMQAAMGTMDYIIDTISAVHSLNSLLGLLKLNGKLVTVGLPNKPLELSIFPIVMGKSDIISNMVQCGSICY